MGSLEMPFEDYGNAPECVVDSKAIPAWEVLESGLIRLFVCKSIHGRLVLDHTDVMTKAAMIAIGKRFLEIANSVDGAPQHWSTEVLNRMLC